MPHRTIGFLALLNLAIASATGAAEQANPEGIEFFEKKIRPVLVQRCYKCHSSDSDNVKGGLLLDTRAAIRRGGESGDAVVPHDVQGSMLIDAIRYESSEMPPDGKLADDVINDFVKWIEMGAPDPRDGQAGLIKREIDFDEGRGFWSFQRPVKVDPPRVENDSWPRSDIDRFVLAELEASQLKPVRTADRRSLVRRIYFDLIGLPPSPQEIDDFVNDSSPEAIENLIDRLLESKHFGERWGRHWLDVARFAESNGRERNFLYPHAWRYRDYVIQSFNSDKPFDQFVREQIAGDLIPSDDNEVKDQRVVATGFLALGPKSLNERDREKFLMDIVDEQIDVSTRSVMALTVSCARCHDHKFDPIPTEEYYAVAGIFRSSETWFGTGGRGNRHASQLVALSESDPEAIALRAEYEQQLDNLNRQLQIAERELRRFREEGKQVQVSATGPTERSTNPLVALREMTEPELKKALQQLKREQRNLTRDGPPPTGAVAMAVQEGDITDCNVLVRGEVEIPGDQVARGYLTILSENEPPKVSGEQSGRLEFANWLTSTDNPLTARVFVNRIWHYLFGQGLVRTVDNFGATGSPPTHPQLLDWLAVEFMQDGWSVKAMLRKVMLSRTYQLSSKFRKKNYDVDPDNRLLWRMNARRLDAESLRDAMLAVSGQIDLAAADGSVVASFGSNDSLGRTIPPSAFETDSLHRSVYLPIVRNAVPNSLRVFDFAEPSIIVGSRTVTTVPSQALYLLNSQFVMEQSDHAARRLLAIDEMDDVTRAAFAYELILGREPQGTELLRAMQYVKQSLSQLEQQNSDQNSWKDLAGASFTLGDQQPRGEQLQRAVEHVEATLNKLKELQQNETKRRELAWSGFCQALFASADFRYVE